MLTITEAASDLQLLSQEELRVAAGLESSDSSADDALAVLGLRAAAALAAACGVTRGGYDASYLANSPPLRGEAPRTLKAETVSETFRFRSHYGSIYLARRPVLAISMVTEDSSELGVDDFEYDVPQGALMRVSGDSLIQWAMGRITVVYEAGYETIPEDLKGFAAQLVSLYYQSEGDDPNVKHEEIPGVISIDRWVDTKADNIVPDDIMAGLIRGGYRKPALA